MNFDEILQSLGTFGRYQMRIYFLLCLPAIPTAMHMLASVFIAYTPKFRCAIPGYDGDTYDAINQTHELYIKAFIPDDDFCHVYTGVNMTSPSWNLLKLNGTTWEKLNITMKKAECSAWVYDRSTFQETIITQFNLVCNDAPLATYATVIFMGGVLVGAFGFGFLSDAIGRKKTLLIAIFLQGASGVGCAFSPNYVAFVILRLLVGAANAGIFTAAFVLVIESFASSVRVNIVLSRSCLFALSYPILSGMAYGLRDWSKIQFVASALAVVYFIGISFIPESARWLLAQGRKDEAEKIIRRAAKENRVTLPEKMFDEEPAAETSPSMGLIEIIKELVHAPTLLIRSLVVFFNWMVVSMVYYGLALNSGNLGGDVFVNFILAGIVEFPAYGFCFACKWLGRKYPHAGNMFLGGLACISTIFVVLYFDSNNDWLIALSMTGKFGATVGFTILYFWSAEIFPTICRSGLLGLSSTFARVGGMVCAPIADSGKILGGPMGVALPQIVFGGLTITAGLLSLILPETTGRELPESIEDGNNFSMSNKEIEKRPDNETTNLYVVPSYKKRDAEEMAYSNPALDKAVEAEDRL